jgi:LysR family transcriptional regulator, nitrogen assimilation regulatory protein
LRDDDVDLSHWRLLVLLSELGSLSKAAIAQDRPHSVISRQLSALERECGGPLFYRTGRGVVLSELGQQIMPRVRALLFEADELSREVKAHAGEVAGSVRIGLVPSVAQVMVEPLVTQMQARFPQVRLSLMEAANVQLGEGVSNGTLDLALLFRERRNLAATEEALSVVPAWFVGPAGDPFTSRAEAPFREIDGKPMVLTSRSGQFRQRFDYWAERLAIRPVIAVEADSLAIQKRLISAGVGYGLLTPLAMGAELKSGELTAARIVDPAIEFVIALCRTMKRPLTLPARECVKLINEIASGLPGMERVETE